MRGKWHQRAEFRARMAQRKADYDRLKAERIRLREGFDEDDDSNYVVTETFLEEVLETTEQVMHSL